MKKSYFYDGNHAIRHDVILALSLSGLTIRNVNGDRLAYWAFTDCVIGTDEDQDAVRFSNRKSFGARLTVFGDEAHRIAQAVRKALGPQPRFTPVYLLFALPLSCAVALATYASFGPPLGKPLLAYIPTTVDEHVGDLVFNELKADLEFCDNEKGNAALNKLVSRLTKAAGETPFTFQVRVAESDEVNAFALPGGKIVVLSGLLKEAESPEEVAGVLAHEMSHVIKRHGMADLLTQLGLQFILFASTGDTNSVITIGRALIESSMSRAQESEADALGADILAKAHISVSGLQSFFRRLEEKSDDPMILELVSSHPLGDKRAGALVDPPGFKAKPILTKKEWKALKNTCPDAQPKRG